MLGSSGARQPDISPYSFLAGPVQVDFDSETENFVHPDLASLIDEDRQVVTSLTRELSWDWGAGVVTLDAPRAQGVVGALSSATTFALQDITIESDADYASIIAVPLDGQPIADAARLLVQINSIARPTGWGTEPAQHQGGPALQVTAFGQAPWQIDRVQAQVSIRNERLSRATALDANGMATREITVSRSNGILSLVLPDDALYVILE